MLDLTTPSLLFSAISLILLAYTNRFLSYASVVRALKEKHLVSIHIVRPCRTRENQVAGMCYISK